jgi:DNA-binding LytR/AlgR family response regulator
VKWKSFFSNYESFVRIDRGTIVNSDRIAEIDYRNEFIRFDNMKKIGVGSKSLKSFRKDIYMWEEGS